MTNWISRLYQKLAAKLAGLSTSTVLFTICFILIIIVAYVIQSESGNDVLSVSKTQVISMDKLELLKKYVRVLADKKKIWELPNTDQEYYLQIQLFQLQDLIEIGTDDDIIDAIVRVSSDNESWPGVG